MPKFIAQEIYANKYGFRSRTVSSTRFQLKKPSFNRFLGSALASRFGGTMGAYALSGIGFDIGKTTGELIAGPISDKETLASFGGMVGALAGTSGGARIGASAFSGASIGGGATAAIDMLLVDLQ